MEPHYEDRDLSKEDAALEGRVSTVQIGVDWQFDRCFKSAFGEYGCASVLLTLDMSPNWQ